MARLRLENIVRNFGKVKGVFNVSVDIDDGEFFVMLGPSGCGKTTTLRIIAGLETPDSGKVFLDEKEITDFPPRERDMAMVFQNYALYPFLTVADNIAFPLKKRKIPPRLIQEKVEEAARVLGISNLLEMKPGQISGGQRQRVALGRAIVREPSVFLMDEPLSNLDAKLRTSMRGELKRIQKNYGTTTIYVTHDQVEAMTLADRVAVMNNGIFTQLDSPLEIYNRPNDTFVATFVGDPKMNMIPAELVNDGNSTNLKIGNTIVDLDLSGLSMPAGIQSMDVSLGIRPEDVKIVEGGLDGKIVVTQNLGKSKIEHIQLSGNNVEVIRMAGVESDLESGRSVSVMPNESKFYIFDSASGNRMWPLLG